MLLSSPHMTWMSCTGALLRRCLGLGLLAAALLVLLMTLATSAQAEEAQPFQAPAGQEAQESGQNADPEANLPYLFAVYIITWLAFFGYVFYMSRRQREMQREIDELKRTISDSESRDDARG